MLPHSRRRYSGNKRCDTLVANGRTLTSNAPESSTTKHGTLPHSAREAAVGRSNSGGCGVCESSGGGGGGGAVSRMYGERCNCCCCCCSAVPSLIRGDVSAWLSLSLSLSLSCACECSGVSCALFQQRDCLQIVRGLARQSLFGLGHCN